MDYQTIVSTVGRCFEATRGRPHQEKYRPYLEGSPGCGKSAVSDEIGRAGGYDNVLQLFASLRDPVDLLGVPYRTGDICEWAVPADLNQLASGHNLLIIEELSDCPVSMQNALCGLIYDGKVGSLRLSPETDIIATGNRVQDRSGAQRLTTKLANRVNRLTFDVSVDQFRIWAARHGAPVSLTAFIAARPQLLNEFAPDQPVSPTPRSWAYVMRLPESLSDGPFMETVKGYVGEGAAAQYVAFRRMMDKLPDPREVLENPSIKIPSEPDLLYALANGVAHHATPENFPKVVAFTRRIPKEFGIMCVRDSISRNREVQSCRAFAEWVCENQEVLI